MVSLRYRHQLLRARTSPEQKGNRHIYENMFRIGENVHIPRAEQLMLPSSASVSFVDDPETSAVAKVEIHDHGIYQARDTLLGGRVYLADDKFLQIYDGWDPDRKQWVLEVHQFKTTDRILLYNHQDALQWLIGPEHLFGYRQFQEGSGEIPLIYDRTWHRAGDDGEPEQVLPLKVFVESLHQPDVDSDGWSLKKSPMLSMLYHRHLPHGRGMDASCPSFEYLRLDAIRIRAKESREQHLTFDVDDPSRSGTAGKNQSGFSFQVNTAPQDAPPTFDIEQMCASGFYHNIEIVISKGFAIDPLFIDVAEQ